MSFAFTPQVVAGVVGHLNADHAADCLLIAQRLGSDVPDGATSARAVTVDVDGLVFAVTAGAREGEVRVPWFEPIHERGDIRAQVVRMYEQAGGAPRH